MSTLPGGGRQGTSWDRGARMDQGSAPEQVPHRAKRVSMADVARLAGVSSQTVSRVSNGRPGVIAATRQQVLAAMHELGYRPNSAARALRRGEVRTLGDRQSTRLHSSHVASTYAVFCLKKK